MQYKQKFLPLQSAESFYSSCSSDHIWKQTLSFPLLLYPSHAPAPAMAGLSTATPIACRPLSTYKVTPVMAEARGEARKAAVVPTSSEGGREKRRG